jgi:ADP-ribosylglycohydrolase
MKSPQDLVSSASTVVKHPALRDAIQNAVQLASTGASTLEAAAQLGCTGFVVHTVGITTFSFIRFGDDPAVALAEAVRAGGDTDSHAAIVGAWIGARGGLSSLPPPLVSRLNDGPFGPSHLRSLADDLMRARGGQASRQARYSWPVAMARNLALYPVVVFHAFRILLTR